jgi:hypothetical protein
MPSHDAALHGSCALPAAQAGRAAPTGLPTIGVQVPSVPFALQASHWPEHPELQQ